MSHTEHETCRKRLLEAAVSAFAEKGFANVRVREICEAAGANIAAINYHFGDKKGLYSEVLHHAFFGITGGDPLAWDAQTDASPEQRMREFVRNLLTQLLSERRSTLYIKLVTHELADPTSALERVIDEGMAPQMVRLMDVVRDLLGHRVEEQTVRRAAGSVLGQCLYYHFAAAVIRRMELEEKLDDSVIEDLTEHITRFSLAALDRMGRS